jgi:hypothetical protein
MKDRERDIDFLGRIGEKIIINMLSREGKIVEESIDPYDREKDMICDGKTIEVKTQVPFVTERAFTFKPNQLKKCRNVDVLYFISVPANRLNFKWDGYIFQADPESFRTRKRSTRDGRVMILVDIEQDALKPIQKLSDEEVETLRKYTVTGY